MSIYRIIDDGELRGHRDGGDFSGGRRLNLWRAKLFTSFSRSNNVTVFSPYCQQVRGDGEGGIGPEKTGSRQQPSLMIQPFSVSFRLVLDPTLGNAFTRQCVGRVHSAKSACVTLDPAPIDFSCRREFVNFLPTEIDVFDRVSFLAAVFQPRFFQPGSTLAVLSHIGRNQSKNQPVLPTSPF